MTKKFPLFLIINILITASISTAVYFILLKVVKIDIITILNYLPCIVCGVTAVSVTFLSAVIFDKRQKENSFRWIKYSPYEKEFDIVFWTKDSNKYSNILIGIKAVSVVVLSFNIIIAYAFERLVIVPTSLSSIVIAVTYILHNYLILREDFNKNEQLNISNISDKKMLDNYHYSKLAYVCFVISLLVVSIILSFFTLKLFLVSIIIASFILLLLLVLFIISFRVDSKNSL